ncbi:MAG TPA: GNAT family N-acetyltransferase [Candidatus Limnocylindrales bacterium]
MAEAIRIVSSRTEDLDAATRAGIIRTCNAAFAKDEFDELFTRYIPSGGRHVYALDGDEVVAHAVATTRWLHLGQVGAPGTRRLRTGWIDAVATAPDHQHRGIGSQVMRRIAIDIADYELGGLATDVRGFYEPRGWENWRGPLAGLKDDLVVPTPDMRDIFVLRLDATRDLDLDAALTVEFDGRIWE